MLSVARQAPAKHVRAWLLSDTNNNNKSGTWVQPEIHQELLSVTGKGKAQFHCGEVVSVPRYDPAGSGWDPRPESRRIHQATY